MARKRIPEEVKQEIVRRVSEGRGKVVQLARHFKISQSSASRIARENGGQR